MQIIYINSSQNIPKIDKPLAVAIGNFDGLHKGHKKLFQQLTILSEEENLFPAIISFDPHPASVLSNKTTDFHILTLKEKTQKLEELGIEKLILIKFSKDFSKLSAQDFLNEYIKPLPIKYIIVGENFRFGHKQSADISLLQTYCNKNSIKLIPYSLLKLNDEKISSTKLRDLIKEGKLMQFKSLTGYNYPFQGKVIEGDKRGRQLGFPTANIDFPKEKITPKIGVYLVKVIIDEKEYFGVMNIGHKPTFNNEKNLSFEIHIFDFNQDIYNKTLTTEILEYLREEKKFSSILELKNQITNDVKEAKKLLQKNTNN